MALKRLREFALIDRTAFKLGNKECRVTGIPWRGLVKSRVAQGAFDCVKLFAIDIGFGILGRHDVLLSIGARAKQPSPAAPETMAAEVRNMDSVRADSKGQHAKER